MKMAIVSTLVRIEITLALLVLIVLAIRAFGPPKARDQLERFASQINPHWMP
jgi:hypothetical protein